MTLGAKTISLESSFYTEKLDGKCFSRIQPQIRNQWVIGDAWLNKFYTEYNLKKDEEKVTFYVAK